MHACSCAIGRRARTFNSLSNPMIRLSRKLPIPSMKTTRSQAQVLVTLVPAIVAGPAEAGVAGAALMPAVAIAAAAEVAPAAAEVAPAVAEVPSEAEAALAAPH